MTKEWGIHGRQQMISPVEGEKEYKKSLHSSGRRIEGSYIFFNGRRMQMDPK
ncbi:MAG: hypothetical protein LUF85_12540 [Bacteroides sp.]|nr:hypothetical protein [Bacteroides sp.]